MKKYQAILYYLIFSAACAGKQPSSGKVPGQDAFVETAMPVTDSFPVKKVIEKVTCKSDASQSYALYIPSEKKTDAIIYFFDPHADGVLPVKKYRLLADKYNFILAGSNNSKNGNDWQTTGATWRAIFGDIQNRLSFDKNRVYTCGFSGGAKVAGYIALNDKTVKSVIAGGASLPDGTPAGDFAFSFTAIAGKGDMNMTDLMAINDALSKTQTRHRIIYFNGKHEWAPLNTMDIAFAGLEFDAMRDNTLPVEDSFIKQYLSNSKIRLDSDIRKNDMLQADNECVLTINMLDGITDVNWFKQKQNEIESGATFKKQLQQQQQLFTIEQNKKTEFNEQFQKGDLNYWKTTIHDLNVKSKTVSPETAMNQRLLAYLSLAFYSISNNLINNNQDKEAAYFVTLYKMADPTNSEAWYFSAILDARKNNTALTEYDLQEAIKNGFTDMARMQEQPEFKHLQPRLNYTKIEATPVKN